MALKKVNKTSLCLLESNLARNGKRIRASRNLFFSLRKLKHKSFSPLASLLRLVINTAQPLVRIISKKIGGGVYRIPVYLFPNKARKLTVKWIVRSSCGRKLGSTPLALLKEFQAILTRNGSTLQKRKTLHNLAVANRAYIKYL